jgi:hypothetical protein
MTEFNESKRQVFIRYAKSRGLKKELHLPARAAMRRI